jgi:hypothetical protein
MLLIRAVAIYLVCPSLQLCRNCPFSSRASKRSAESLRHYRNFKGWLKLLPYCPTKRLGWEQRERGMAALALRFFRRASAGRLTDIETLVSVGLFTGLGLLISISAIVLDKYTPGEWF